MELALRIIAILFPMFALTALGYGYGRRHAADMSVANRLNMDIFVPALIFAGLAGRSFDLAGYGALALGMVLMILGSGAVGWLLARLTKQSPRMLAPPLMFNNCVNLGVPLTVLTFGNEALPWAIVLFVVSTSLHFSLGVWLMDHNSRLTGIWRIPALIAAVAGFAMSKADIAVWPPLLTAIKMLGDISIPLALFSLGVRMTDSSLANWRIGLLGALARPLAGMLLTWALIPVLGLSGKQAAVFFIYGALPPAVINYIFAERYQQQPDKVAAIVLLGNLLSIVVLPIALAIALTR